MGVRVTRQDADALTTFVVRGRLCRSAAYDSLIAFYLTPLRERVLWDLRLAAQPVVDGADAPTLGRMVAEMANRPGSGRVAMLLPADTSDARVMMITQAYATFLPRPENVRLFRTPDRALEWLRELRGFGW